MKYFAFIVILLVVLSGCSSKTETNSAAPNAAGPGSGPNAADPNANSAAATNSAPGGMQPYNGSSNFNPAAFNAPHDNLKVVNAQPKKDELPYGSRLAPDDSIISSGSRGQDFFEMRTFKNHPTIAKVEKLMDGKTTKYKVYLKNGKVVDAPADKMENFAAMAPQNILDAIGMLPKNDANQQVKPVEKKPQ
ncbi:MAG: hypothetical protein JSS81_22005 [Acidobacteria bacterium]|nr:hypothetical protein [Acidobacteriota bacterium]